MLSDQTTIYQLADMLKAMGHPLRLRIMTIIVAERVVSIPTLQRGLPDTDPFCLYTNLRYMQKKRLLKKLRKGREIYYGLSEKALASGFDSFFRPQPDAARLEKQTAPLWQHLNEQTFVFS